MVLSSSITAWYGNCSAADRMDLHGEKKQPLFPGTFTLAGAEKFPNHCLVLIVSLLMMAAELSVMSHINDTVPEALYEEPCR